MMRFAHTESWRRRARGARYLHVEREAPHQCERTNSTPTNALPGFQWNPRNSEGNGFSAPALARRVAPWAIVVQQLRAHAAGALENRIQPSA
jgi:hypothetical protein